ncbi:MAG: S41 family peptidase [Gemmatimonadaceae bacterium]
MDYVRQLGALVLDHRFRRLTESFLRAGEECYATLDLSFRARWASTYLLLEESGPLGITEIADALKLTHPAVIAITDEMRDAGILSSARDREDARRRAVALTTKGRNLSKKLHELWAAMAQTQRRRFADAGCDIVAVLDAVDESLVSQPLVADILSRVRGAGPRKKKRAAVTVAFGLVAMLLRAAAVEAQSAVDPAVRAALVQAAGDSLVNGYIYEERGRAMRDSLLVVLRRGDFDAAQAPGVLARRIGEFLQRVGNDKHLYLVHEGAAQPSAPTRVRRPPGSSGSAAGNTHGLERIEILPGNVGYVDVLMFSDDPGAAFRVDSMMATFAGVSALVIDLRHNIGGAPQLIRHISTYLFDKPTHLVSSFARGMAAPMERWTLDQVPGKRLTNTPVYILTSRRTISAGESFTFGLKAAGRITIVGERTAGGGHFGRVIPLVGGYRMFLPVGRTYDPRTNEGWQADGIAPDVEVPQEQALERALELVRSRSRG